MATGATVSATRQRRATEAFEALGEGRADHEQMTVQCPHGHHLGAVYATDVGPVVVTRPGPHAHGSKDFVDTRHHAGAHVDRYDLLEVGRGGSDGIPAWCDCGPVELSRAFLEGRLRAGARTARIG